MTPDFPDEVTIAEPGEEEPDPVTGNPVAGPPVVRTVMGNLQRRPYFVPEEQAFVRNDWLLLLPAGDPITSRARVEGRGLKFHVNDLPATRRDGADGWRDAYVAVHLKHISDL